MRLGGYDQCESLLRRRRFKPRRAARETELSEIVHLTGGGDGPQYVSRKVSPVVESRIHVLDGNIYLALISLAPPLDRSFAARGGPKSGACQRHAHRILQVGDGNGSAANITASLAEGERA